MTYLLYVLTVAFVCSTYTSKLIAEDAKTPPQAVLFPWRDIDLQAEDLVTSKQELSSAHQLLRRSLLKDAKNISSYVSQAMTQNALLKSREIFAGDTSLDIDLAKGALVFEPIWCKVSDYYVFQLQVSDLNTDRLLLAHHLTMPVKEWKALKAQKQLSSHMETLVSSLVSGLRNRVDQVINTDGTALTAGFSLAREGSRFDLGSRQCVLQLIEENLASKFAIERNLGGETIHFLRDLLGVTSKFARKTRTMTVDFAAEKSLAEAPYYALPQKFSTNISFSESVFGSPVAKANKFTAEISAGEGQLLVKVDDQIGQFLQREEKSLSLTELPQVVKINGAWVYLDRGRAYGLKINDRMVFSGSQGEIKGHVVGFFGPQLKLMSPRGFPVEEGAIVYIRKGQSLTEVGQMFSFDTTAYPTPWPPGG